MYLLLLLEQYTLTTLRSPHGTEAVETFVGYSFYKNDLRFILLEKYEEKNLIKRLGSIIV